MYLFWIPAVAYRGDSKATAHIQVSNFEWLLTRLKGKYIENHSWHESWPPYLLNYTISFGALLKPTAGIHFFNATVSFILQLQCIFTNGDMLFWLCTNYSTIFGIRQLIIVGIRYVVDSPNPSPDQCYCKIWFCRSSYRKWITVESIRFMLSYLVNFIRIPSVPPMLIILGFVSVEIYR